MYVIPICLSLYLFQFEGCSHTGALPLSVIEIIIVLISLFIFLHYTEMVKQMLICNIITLNIHK